MNDEISGGEALFKKSDGQISIPLRILIILLSAIFIFYFSFTITSVDGESMQNTLENEQCVVLERHWFKISRGDIVVFKVDKTAEKFLIKRVIGLGGDKLLFVASADNIYVDLYIRPSGSNFYKLVDEPYIKERMERGATYEKVNVIAHPETDITKLDFSTESADPIENAIKTTIEKNTFAVPDGEFFFMGDNRNNSNDSRHYGTRPMGYIYGKQIAALEKNSAAENFFKFAFGQL